MIRWDIIFAGVGGQGMLSCGNMLGEVASVDCGLNATMSAAYGVESRGTFTKADLIISSEEIDFPEVENPKIIFCMHQVAYDRYVSAVGPETTILYDNSLIEEKPSKAAQFGYPVSETAEKAQLFSSANIIATGILIGKFDILPQKAVERVIAMSRPTAAALNIVLFQRGIAMAESK